ncbi:MAG: NAD(P)H-dependent oxidoreductase subunit E [Eubacterium aggregans]|jgi:NADH:ubiquinone oxidoreductase subunit E|uniref:Thioredoxin-like [2Fe-2S] ferredoxin n=1 Tax=Eubacterium aggregans TaxID=81409 RepID=A0A1H3XJK0_9FIRM|nr:NAD(P)H-dependent oxidoreductase subunit E [Eubacterium aggregans]MDD4690703.1 NAD(P)H-dependent oxidoreductase subunit E [Eubacterium aggregans]MEA5072626.1 NAD(P)H-dependent oxidoreductase subunit E [Eubacterium aggregans]SDZ99440.1 Thioredoxin-like [2Fe-2S] ferredoxin [Eubacterium aggregans]
MDHLQIEVCVCSACILKGAMDIIDSIESLGEVQDITGLQCSIEIKPVSCLGLPGHGKNSPIVRIGDNIIECATMETVMAHIMALA